MWVKICGIRDVPTVRWVAELKPDAIGINFFRGSPRCVDEATAKDITSALPSSVEAVGVFVDQSVVDIIRICRKCQILTAQLHDDYSLADVETCGNAGLSVIRVIRLSGQVWPIHLAAELDQQASRHNIRYLVDAHVPGAYGGTGQVVPWELLHAHWQKDWPPLILAGGLTIDNVHEAIQAVKPFGVDVASGVETSPGVKDRMRVRQFIDSTRRATPGD